MASPERTFGSLLRSFSIETTPLDHGVPADLPRGTHVYVASVPKARKDQLVARVVQLRKAGFVPVPHVVARGIESADLLGDFLSRLRGEADVDRVLVLGGDTDRPAGPFASSRDILETGLFAEHGFNAVGFATYAEDHPAITRDVLDRELELKLAGALRQGLQRFVVSQFSFDAEAMIAHVVRLRGQGVDVPFRIGLAGPASFASLARFAMLCGVRNSARFLSRQGNKMGRLLTNYDPAETVAELVRLLDARGGLEPVAVHIFAFGGLQKSVDWANSLRAESGVGVS